MRGSISNWTAKEVDAKVRRHSPVVLALYKLLIVTIASGASLPLLLFNYF